MEIKDELLKVLDELEHHMKTARLGVSDNNVSNTAIAEETLAIVQRKLGSLLAKASKPKIEEILRS